MDCSKLNLNETMQAVMSRQEEIAEENKDRDNTDGVARIIYMFSQMMIKQLILEIRGKAKISCDLKRHLSPRTVGTIISVHCSTL